MGWSKLFGDLKTKRPVTNDRPRNNIKNNVLRFIQP